MTAGGREFQVAGAAQLKGRLPTSVRLKCTSRNGTADDGQGQGQGLSLVGTRSSAKQHHRQDRCALISHCRSRPLVQ